MRKNRTLLMEDLENRKLFAADVVEMDLLPAVTDGYAEEAMRATTHEYTIGHGTGPPSWPYLSSAAGEVSIADLAGKGPASVIIIMDPNVHQDHPMASIERGELVTRFALPDMRVVLHDGFIIDGKCTDSDEVTVGSGSTKPASLTGQEVYVQLECELLAEQTSFLAPVEVIDFYVSDAGSEASRGDTTLGDVVLVRDDAGRVVVTHVGGEHSMTVLATDTVDSGFTALADLDAFSGGETTLGDIVAVKMSFRPASVTTDAAVKDAIFGTTADDVLVRHPIDFAAMGLDADAELDRSEQFVDEFFIV